MRLDRKPAASRSPAPARGTSGGVASTGTRTPADVVDAALLDGRAEPGSGAPPALSAAGVLNLQRVAGNAAVSGYLAGRRPTVQRWGIPLGGFIPAHPELREGQTGEAVRELQEKLSLATAAGGALTADGDFGPATRRRLRAFRTSKGLGTSPVADAALWTALDAAVAGLPAPVRPVLSVGSTGPDVALAQQKLNAFAGAAAPLPIDGVFTIVMTAFVSAFQAGTAHHRQRHDRRGHVDQARHGVARRRRPDGGRGARRAARRQPCRAPSPLGAPLAGTTLHRPVGPGGLMRGPAVREFQLKLNVWRNSQALAPITDDGKWGNDTRTATVAFQIATPGLRTAVPASAIRPTWTALDAIAGTVAVGFHERQWQEEVGGATYAHDERRPGQARATRGRSAPGHPRDVQGAVHRCRAAIAHGSGTSVAQWNIFKAVREGTNESLLINFDMVSGQRRGLARREGGAAADDRTAPTRARGTWPTPTSANGVPHEFGHLIGLRDEYQLHPGDFRAITGREPDVGSTAGPVGVTPLHDRHEPAGGDDGPQLGERVHGRRRRAAGRVRPADRGAVRDAGRGHGAGCRGGAGRGRAARGPADDEPRPRPGGGPRGQRGLDKYNTIQVLTY